MFRIALSVPWQETAKNSLPKNCLKRNEMAKNSPLSLLMSSNIFTQYNVFILQKCKMTYIPGLNDAEKKNHNCFTLNFKSKCQVIFWSLSILRKNTSSKSRRYCRAEKLSLKSQVLSKSWTEVLKSTWLNPGSLLLLVIVHIFSSISIIGRRESPESRKGFGF